MPPPRFRRSFLINRDIHPNVYYKIAVLDDIRASVTDGFEGYEELTQMFEQGPFGHFLRWVPGQNSRKLLGAIISRCIHSEQGIWFHFRGRDIEYTIEDHALNTGMNFGPHEFDPRIARDPTKVPLFRTVCGLQVENGATLLSRFKELGPQKDPSGEVRLKLAHLLVANFFLIGHDAQSPVYPWLWDLADDLDAFYTFPWGAYSYKALQYYLRTFKTKANKYHMYGAAWALITWALEVMPGLGDKFAIRDTTENSPRCLKWKFITSFPGVGKTELYAAFDDEDRELSMMMADEAEAETGYFLSACQVDAMLVKFHVPKDSYIQVEQPTRRRAHPEPPHDLNDNTRPARRSVRSTRYSGSLAEEGTSSSHQPRFQQGISREEWAGIVEEGVSRANERAKDFFVATVKESENRIMTNLKKWFSNIGSKLVCGSSSVSTAVHHPRPLSPPLRRSPVRDSSVRVSGSEVSDDLHEQLQNVGTRADTSLPIFTPSFSEPYIGEEPAPHVSSAFDSIFGQV